MSELHFQYVYNADLPPPLRQIYDKDDAPVLVTCLCRVMYLKPSASILISVTVRNPDTFESFTNECLRNCLIIEDVPLLQPQNDEGLVGGYSEIDKNVRLLRIHNP